MVGFVLIAIMQNTPNMILTNGEVKMNCNRKDICYNYPKHCELCQATSDMLNCYPCFQDKDIVEVVRCKDCKYSTKDKYHAVSVVCTRFKTGQFTHRMQPMNFCSYGERKEE